MNVITQVALKAWLDRLASETVLFAPQTVDGLVLYRPVANSSAITFEYTRPKMSPKQAVFPSTDLVVSLEKQGQDVTLAEPSLEKKQVIFGLRPCDAHGISVLDAVYIGREPVDASYAGRRQATALVGLACPQMWDGCFCASMGGAPDDPSCMDVLLTAVADGYAVNTVTEKGKALIAGLEQRQVAGDPPPPTLGENVPVLPGERWPQRFADRYWDLLAERCLSCRVCTYVCPTCRCFDVRDEVAERRTNYARYDRLRCWDACTSPNYRVTAGGHNPRPTKGTRLRNRFFCKFYYMMKDYGANGCVGCGRCIESCPVNIDIVEMLHDVSQPLQVEVMA